MGRRKKDDGTYLLAVGLFGVGWLACKAAKALFSLPKIPNPPPSQIRVPQEDDNEWSAFCLGVFLLLFVGLLNLISDVFLPLFGFPVLCFVIGFVCRHKRLKKKRIQQNPPFVSNTAPVIKPLCAEKKNICVWKWIVGILCPLAGIFFIIQYFCSGSKKN